MYNKPHTHNNRLVKRMVLDIIVLIALAVWLIGCSSPRNGCHATRRMSGYGQTGFGKPLCPVKNCTYFSGFTSDGTITACIRHCIDDYEPKDSVMLLPYKKEMTFGY